MGNVPKKTELQRKTYLLKSLSEKFISLDSIPLAIVLLDIKLFSDFEDDDHA
jgi:hypothetical protein